MVAISGMGISHPAAPPSPEPGPMQPRGPNIKDSGKDGQEASPTEPQVTHPDQIRYDADTHTLSINTDSKEDAIRLDEREDGTVEVTVNGHTSRYKKGDIQKVTVASGGGRDHVTTAGKDQHRPGEHASFELEVDAGSGDDTVIGSGGKNRLIGNEGNDRLIGGNADDQLLGGKGRDYLEAGQGQDLLAGGEGDDIAYGGRGDDRIIDIAGNNHLDGGKDDDFLTTLEGKSVVSGGRGNDTIHSGGTDKVYAGEGRDTVKNMQGHDTVYAQFDDDILEGASSTLHFFSIQPDAGTQGVRLEGDDAFLDRVEDDLDTLRSSPTGTTMLTALDKARGRTGKTVTISESTAMRDDEANYARLNGARPVLRPDGTPGPAADVNVTYKPSFLNNGVFRVDVPTPSILGLYHELAHGYNAITGTMQPAVLNSNASGLPGHEPREPQAIGVDDDQGIAYDHDGDPNTPDETGNPFALTENGLRAEFGLERRTHH